MVRNPTINTNIVLSFKSFHKSLICLFVLNCFWWQLWDGMLYQFVAEPLFCALPEFSTRKDFRKERTENTSFCRRRKLEIPWVQNSENLHLVGDRTQTWTTLTWNNLLRKHSLKAFHKCQHFHRHWIYLERLLCWDISFLSIDLE